MIGSLKHLKNHENEVWQCDNCAQIFIGTLADKMKTKYEDYYKSQKKPIVSENPYESACKCCIDVQKIGEYKEGDINE